MECRAPLQDGAGVAHDSWILLDFVIRIAPLSGRSSNMQIKPANCSRAGDYDFALGSFFGSLRIAGVFQS
jgi:hypothetical protein